MLNCFLENHELYPALKELGGPFQIMGEKVQAENILEEVIKEMKADAEMELRSDKGSHHAD
ncbi:MAG TPA: hypothetical protein VEV87_01125 [Chitinophagaceae bacterium]|nr:hypothetical protein [Chitinophagaceae bacterium]